MQERGISPTPARTFNLASLGFISTQGYTVEAGFQRAKHSAVIAAQSDPYSTFDMLCIRGIPSREAAIILEPMSALLLQHNDGLVECWIWIRYDCQESTGTV